MVYNMSRLTGGASSCILLAWLRQDGIRKLSRPVRRLCAASTNFSSGSFEDIQKLYPLAQQTITLPGPERIRMSKINEKVYRPDQLYSDVTTMCEGFQRGKLISKDGPFLGGRPGDDQHYEWMTYSQVEEKAILFGSGLIALGNQPGSETFIGLFSQNRPEWTISDLACMHYSIVSVPFFNTIDNKACDHIINQTNMSTIVCDTLAKANRLRQDHSALQSLKTLVVMDLPREVVCEEQDKFKADGLHLISFDDVVSLGGRHIVDLVLPKPETINTLVYTSGTTGIPKGVHLTHKNHVAGHAYAWSTVSDEMTLFPEDIHICYLPLPHVYERGNVYGSMMAGVQVGFFQGDHLKLVSDIQDLRPTLLGGVPRVFNRIYDRVMSTVNASSPLKRSLFNLAYKQKLKAVERGYCGKDTIWDKLVFSKVQSLMGGRVRLIASAAAPLAPEIAEFFRVTMGCKFMEAYGQTECTLCITHTLEADHSCGQVGTPGGDSMIKLIDVPELNYYSADDQGEVCVKGAHVFSGYYKDPEQTKEVLDDDGWVHTGDIGQWNKNGTLSIIDRKKNIFKLSQGVYIVPEKIENVYLRVPLVAQAFVTGTSLQDCLVGIVVPDREELEIFAKKQRIPGTFEELCRNERVRSAVFISMTKYGEQQGLASFEQVRGIHIHSELFTEANGLMTPTFKNKRPVLDSVFADQTKALYAEIQGVSRDQPSEEAG